MFNKILVPIDGSEHADSALNHALDLAEKYGAEIEIFSVVSTIPTAPIARVHVSPSNDMPLWIDPHVDERRAFSETMLSQTLETTKKAKPNLTISTKVVEGRPADEIIERAKEGDFDLIVMGSRGLGGIAEFFLGSVSSRVTDRAECPVMIVK